MFLKALNLKSQLTFFVYLALTVTILGAFGQVWNFEFTNYDDDKYVSENPHVLNGLTQDGIIWAFTTGHASNWHPITWLSLMLDCQLFGPNSGWMHLVNLLVHLANTLLLFAVLKKMTGSLWPSAFVAAAFAIHPMHVESVAWIAERKDVLSTLFWLLTMLAYLAYVRRPGAFRYALTLVLFALGLMAKPMLVTLPFVLLLLDYWPLDRFAAPRTIGTSGGKSHKPAAIADRRRILYRIIVEKVPFLALAAVSSVITFLVQGSGGAVKDIAVLALKYRVVNVFISYVEYINKMFWPQNLSVFYPYDIRVFLFWRAMFCALLLVGISLLVIRFGRKQRYLPVGWFWFVGTLIPVIGLVQVGQQSLADRYTYIPYIGLFIMIAWGLPELLSKWRYRSPRCPPCQRQHVAAGRDVAAGKLTIGISMVIVLTALGICAYRQVSYWKNSSTLFSHALKATQNNYIAHINLGNYFARHNDVPTAIEHCRKALEIVPNNLRALNNLGCLMAGKGDFKKAIEYLQQAIQVKTDYAEARYNLANALAPQGRFDEAVDQLHTVLRLKPDWPEPMNKLAFLIATCPEIKGRDVNEAVRLARRACELTNYRNTTFLNTLVSAYLSAGRVSEAVDTAEASLNIEPNSASAHRVLEAALLSGGYFKKAIVHIKRFLEIEPNNISAKNDLAWILATNPDPNIRNPSDAIRFAQEACNAINSKDPAVLDTLAAAYASGGRFAEAVDTARMAINLADAANKPQLKNIIQYHLTFYTQDKPYIEPAPK